MKFEDMKKIWDEQNQTHLYVIDEKLLQQSIQTKKSGASRFINKMEWFIIMANSLAAAAILIANFLNYPGHIYAYLMSITLLGSVVYTIYRRSHRLKNENRFDRTLLGDLEHAISNATYRAQLSSWLLTYWVVFGILFVLNFINEGKSLWVVLLALAFCILVFFLGRWEHRSWHLPIKKRLEAMKEKLLESV